MKVGQGLGTAFAEVCSAEDSVSMGGVVGIIERKEYVVQLCLG